MRLLSLRLYVARSIQNHNNATRVAQHNAQYAKLLARLLHVYYKRSKQLPRFCEIMLAKFVFYRKTSIWKINVYWPKNERRSHWKSRAKRERERRRGESPPEAKGEREPFAGGAEIPWSTIFWR